MKIPQITLVFDRKHTATKKKKALLQIQVMYERKRKYIGTGIKLFSDQWDERRRVINHPLSVEYNDAINSQLKELYACIDEMVGKGFIDLGAICLKKNKATDNLIDFSWEIIGGITNENTRHSKITATNNMVWFGRFGAMQSVSLSDLDDYDDWLKKRGCTATTRKLYLSYIKHLFNLARKRGITENDPFALFDYGRAMPKSRCFLTIEEVGRIEAYCPPSKAAEQAKDLFLFQCYTGMGYADVSSLVPKMVEVLGGKYYIRRARMKTGIAYSLVMLPKAKEIWLKYSGKMPSLLLMTYNKELKRIAAACGISKNVSSHVGRHTFATLALSNGVGIEVVSKMLGHTNINTTQIYAKVLAQDVDKGFETLERNLGRKK